MNKQIYKDNLDFSVIVPFYNPEKNWLPNIVSSIQKIQSLLKTSKIELILVNDGSTNDLDLDSINQLNDLVDKFTYISYAKNKGKGFAVREGIKKASGNFCFFTDVDFPYLEENLASMYYELQNNNADIVVGIRNKDYFSKIPSSRSLLSKVFQSVSKLFFKFPISDSQSGLKGFSPKGRDLLLSTKINSYLFDLELFQLAFNQKGINIVSIPVTLKDHVVLTPMKTSVLISEFFSFLRILIKR